MVAVEGGQGITLRDLFQKELGFSAREASVDHLNVHALGELYSWETCTLNESVAECSMKAHFAISRPFLISTLDSSRPCFQGLASKGSTCSTKNTILSGRLSFGMCSLKLTTTSKVWRILSPWYG